MKVGSLPTLVFGVILCSFCAGGSAEARQSYNVVLVSLDTLRADHIPVFGYERNTSPRIRAFAERSIAFDQAFSHSPKTAPSHMSIMTGLLPDAHGVRNFEEGDNTALSGNIQTLASILRAHGWRTAAFTNGGHVRPQLGFGRGFESYDTKGLARNIFENAMAKAEEFGGEPFFLFVHTYEVHDPYVPPRGFREIYADPDYAGRIIGDRQALKAAAGRKWADQSRKFWERVDKSSPEDVQHLQDLYDGSIRYCDKFFGKLIEKLDALGQLDRTLVILLADHGEAFGERGDFLHESVREELLHVPLLVHLPAPLADELRGTHFQEPVQLVDVLPTVLEVLELPVLRHGQGRSLLSLTRGEAWSPRPIVGSWPRQRLHSLRRHPWKLIWHEAAGTRAERLELYDLRSDPGELHDLAAGKPQVVAELKAELDALRGQSLRILAAQGEGEVVELTAEMAEELRALGYLAPVATGAPPGSDAESDAKR